MWRLLWPAVVLLVNSDESWGLVQEYGQDRPGLVLLDQLSGQIKPMDRTKQIALRVPNCMDVKYVKVEVRNRFSTPTASFTKRTGIVKISYDRLSQVTRSKYKITVKGKRIPQCKKGINKFIEETPVGSGASVPPRHQSPPFGSGNWGQTETVGGHLFDGFKGSAGTLGKGSITIDYSVTGGNGGVGWFNGGNWGWSGSSGRGSGGLFVDYFKPIQKGSWMDNRGSHKDF